MTDRMTYINRIREFDRFYTVMLGIVDKDFVGGYSLAETRVLYELSTYPGITAAEIAQKLRLNKGYLSRILKGFAAKGLVEKTASPTDGRAQLLRLTDAGATETQAIMDATNKRIAAQIAPLDDTACEELCRAMALIQQRFSEKEESPMTDRLQLRPVTPEEFSVAMNIINGAKQHLRDQGIDQWQNGYPDEACIRKDIETGKAFFAADSAEVYGYLCVDFDGEPAYNNLQGAWATAEPYVVMHRLAMSDAARGKGLSGRIFALIEELALARGVKSFRVDTDADNHKMQHVLKKNGFTYRGTIWFDNSEKIAFDKQIEG